MFWSYLTKLKQQYALIKTDENMNKKNMVSISGYVAMGAFLLQFPLFSIYHSLAAKGHIPLFLGGYSTLVACILFPLLLYVYISWARTDLRSVSSFDCLFFVFLLYFLSVAIYHYVATNMIETAKSHFAVIIQFISIFITIRLMNIIGNRTRFLLFIVFIVISFDILFSYNYNITRMLLVGRMAAEDKAADYQGYAFIYLVISMFLLANIHMFWSRLAVALVAMVMLFINGARSEFIGFFVIVFVLEYCSTRFRNGLLVVLCVLMVVFIAFINVIPEWLPESRIVSLLSFGIDGSVQERSAYLDFALKNIRENPIIGSYGNYSPGGWAHNALSAWVDLGLLGFIGFVLLLLIPLLNLIFDFKSKSKTKYYALSFSCILFAILLFSTAKYFTYQILPLVMAVYSKYKYSQLASEKLIS